MSEEGVERRLTTILAADVVGYSRLMGEDEVGTLAALKAHRKELIEPKAAQYHGRTVKLMGDGALMEFTSVVDALRFAVEVQFAMGERNREVPEDRQIVYRIGINIGDIIVEGDDIYGDGVNIAARLEGLADPGGICISRPVHTQIAGKLKLEFEDLGEQQFKNIAKTVMVYRVALDERAATLVTPVTVTPPTTGRGRWLQIAAGLVLSVVAVAGLVWWQPWAPDVEPTSVERMAFPLPDRPSIAVLPFDNLSGDPEQEYFADGITEDLTTNLSKISGLFVIARNSAFAYKGKQTDARAIAHELGVKYVLEGSVRRAGQRVRVSARLVDADSGLLLWSEKFDDEKDDIFAVQDTITQQIAGMLITNLRQEELKRSTAKPTNNLDAYDLVLKGRAQLTRASRKSNRDARRMFERAIQVDPNYAAAYAWLARAHSQMAADGWTEFPGEALKRADELATKALTIDPELVEAHHTLARVYSVQFQLERAITEIDRALALNPSDAEAHGDRGVILLWAGRLEEAVTSLETAFKFDPNLRSDYVFAYGLALYSLGRHEDAITILERGAARHRTYVFIPAVLVAAYGQIGRVEEARRNAQKVKRLFPIFDAETFGRRFQNREHYDYLAEGLKKGGLI
ncbi:MAG: tetratricopeptide repeat protein [Proteobacteria bacterium]|nr:tetratricopeptide repeat protein [Pseudomonadota bacterium]